LPGFSAFREQLAEVVAEILQASAGGLALAAE
jgi:hypothetical protein